MNAVKEDLPTLLAGRAALLVIDMQNDFCAPGGYMQRERNYQVGFAQTVADNIARLLPAARAAQMDIVWIHSIYDFKYLSASHIAKREQEGCCLEGSWGAQPFHLEPHDGEMVIRKHHYSGFHGTTLDTYLRARGIQTLVFTGVATNVCVDSTLRAGFFLDYRIVLVEDCVGSNSREGHLGTLATVRNNIGVVTSADAMMHVLQQKEDA